MEDRIKTLEEKAAAMEELVVQLNNSVEQLQGDVSELEKLIKETLEKVATKQPTGTAKKKRKQVTSETFTYKKKKYGLKAAAIRIADKDLNNGRPTVITAEEILESKDLQKLVVENYPGILNEV
jgi:uncharacterized coiled-coil protein SlyX